MKNRAKQLAVLGMTAALIFSNMSIDASAASSNKVKTVLPQAGNGHGLWN